MAEGKSLHLCSEESISNRRFSAAVGAPRSSTGLAVFSQGSLSKLF
jgi:hypothetical protein